MPAEIRSIPLEPDNEGVLQCLEAVMSLAQAGKISMLAITVIEKDGAPYFYRSKVHNYSMMIGAVGRHWYRIQRDADQ